MWFYMGIRTQRQKNDNSNIRVLVCVFLAYYIEPDNQCTPRALDGMAKRRKNKTIRLERRIRF